MAARTINHIKLGIFTVAGIALLIFLLYIIGKNQNLFGDTFILKARFENVQGLMPGNNIRFAGINAGTVKEVEVLNDTTIEVTLLVKTKMKKFIRKNAIVNISTDGIMGNKLLNINAVKMPAALVQDGDVLQSEKSASPDDMLKVLNNTTNDVAEIAMELKLVAKRINTSDAFWKILNDESLPQNIRSSLARAKDGIEHMNSFMSNLEIIVLDIKNGKGSLGEFINDTSIADNLQQSIINIKKASLNIDSLSNEIRLVVNNLNNDINNGKGSVSALLKDEEMRQNVAQSLQHIEKGTRSFEQNMEALKNNFLFRGYFKKLEKHKKYDTSNSNY